MSERPALDALLADPTTVPVERIPDVLAEIERVRVALWARLADGRRPGDDARDRLLTLPEAAAQLGVPEGWLKKRPDLPFRVVLSEGTVRYSARGLEAYIRARAGR